MEVVVGLLIMLLGIPWKKIGKWLGFESSGIGYE